MPTGGGVADRWIALRRELPAWQAVVMGFAGIIAVLALWWFVTRGAPEERIISPSKGLSSPAETFASFHALWFDRALTRNLLTTLGAWGWGLAWPHWSACLWVCCAVVFPGYRRFSCR